MSRICQLSIPAYQESRERPFLVDKRMVTQMLAAYLEQRENPGPQLETLGQQG